MKTEGQRRAPSSGKNRQRHRPKDTISHEKKEDIDTIKHKIEDLEKIKQRELLRLQHEKLEKRTRVKRYKLQNKLYMALFIIIIIVIIFITFYKPKPVDFSEELPARKIPMEVLSIDICNQFQMNDHKLNASGCRVVFPPETDFLFVLYELRLRSIPEGKMNINWYFEGELFYQKSEDIKGNAPGPGDYKLLSFIQKQMLIGQYRVEIALDREILGYMDFKIQ